MTRHGRAASSPRGSCAAPGSGAGGPCRDVASRVPRYGSLPRARRRRRSPRPDAHARAAARLPRGRPAAGRSDRRCAARAAHRAGRRRRPGRGRRPRAEGGARHRRPDPARPGRAGAGGGGPLRVDAGAGAGARAAADDGAAAAAVGDAGASRASRAARARRRCSTALADGPLPLRGACAPPRAPAPTCCAACEQRGLIAVADAAAAAGGDGRRTGADAGAGGGDRAPGGARSRRAIPLRCCCSASPARARPRCSCAASSAASRSAAARSCWCPRSRSRRRRRAASAPASAPAWRCCTPRSRRASAPPSTRASPRGDARIVVGPRSALFAPVADLGLVVIDEEHEAAYKQDSDPRYDARALAILRARHHGAAVLLASATPRPESWRPLERLELPGRIGGRLPPVDIVDLRRDGAYPISRRAARGAGRDRRRGRPRRAAAEPPRRGAGAALPRVRRHVRLPGLRRRADAAPQPGGAALPPLRPAGADPARLPDVPARSTSPASARAPSGSRS